MRLFDCTLRDGANVVGNGFNAALTESILKGLLSCEILDIEFGNAKGLGAYEAQNAQAPLNDEEYLKLVQKYTKKGRLGMFLQASLANEKDIKLAAEHGLDFLRVGASAGAGKGAVDAIRLVKTQGLRCRYSLMKAYLLSPEELANEAIMLEKEGVDAITIMDSAGTMLPREVTEYVQELKGSVSIPVGFHGHSNLGLSQANALAAADAGADEIDCGLLGMARSAGNCATELVAAVLFKEGKLTGVDLFALLDYINRDLLLAMDEYHYHTAVCPDDLVLGLSGCHSSFLEMFSRIAQEEKVDKYHLIMETSLIDRNKPEEKLIREVAKSIRHIQRS